MASFARLDYEYIVYHASAEKYHLKGYQPITRMRSNKGSTCLCLLIYYVKYCCSMRASVQRIILTYHIPTYYVNGGYYCLTSQPIKN